MKLVKILGTSSAIAVLGLAACTVPAPAPLCDRENVEWDKYGTGELPMACLPPPTIVFLPPTEGNEGNDREPPNHVDDPHDPMLPPTHKPPAHEPREKRNNGLGDGDQRAPGNSLSNNKAENERGNPGHKSGKSQNSN